MSSRSLKSYDPKIYNQAMSKSNFVRTLIHFAETRGDQTIDDYGRLGYRGSRCDNALMRGIALWFSLNDNLRDVKDDFGGATIYHDMPELLDEAFEDMRTKPEFGAIRKLFAEDVEGRYEIPSFTNIHEGGLYRSLTIDAVIRLIPIMYRDACKDLNFTDEDTAWLGTKLECYAKAQWGVIEHSWKRFVRTGYRPLIRRIKDESHRGNTGTFGKTTLMTYCMAGRCMFTFRRGRGDDGPSMTYVADDSDMYGHRAGPNVPDIPYTECVAMIEEVVNNWNIDKMKRDDKIGMGF